MADDELFTTERSAYKRDLSPQRHMAHSIKHHTLLLDITVDAVVVEMVNAGKFAVDTVPGTCPARE